MLKKIVFPLAVGILIGSAVLIRSQTRSRVALTGLVSSNAEGPMEGVLVSAKRAGGTITVTVVSDEKGRYIFPAGKISPGKYNLSIRAIGYVASSPGAGVNVSDEKTTEADIKLSKTQDLASQLSAAEWLMSVPGTEQQKDALFTCVECHAATPILKSTYDAAGWLPTIARMHNFSPQSTLSDPIMLPYQHRRRYHDTDFAKYLSSINLSSRSKWDFKLKTLPRPKGKSTKVIITEYDLPNPDRQPHDVVIDKEGMVWYDDFALPILGRMDPRTGKTKEWTLPELKPGFPVGSLELELGPKGNLWIAKAFQGGIQRFDKKTGKVTSWSEPAEYNNAHTRTTFLAVARNGMVWFTDSTNRRMNLLDPATGKIKSFAVYPGMTKAELAAGIGARGATILGHLNYGIGVDSQGNGWMCDRGGSNIAEIDPNTGKVTLYPTPSPNSGPRRMHIDSEDRIWFGEYYDLKIAEFDPKTKRFREWPDPTPWDAPYDVVRDKDGYLWTGGMTTDIITRFNPKTGEFDKYLLPGLGVNVRRVEVDNSTNPPTFWVGENHLGKIAKIEPLE